MPTFKLSDLTDKPELIHKLNQLGGGGGSSTLSGLSDVDVSTVTNGQILVYNSNSGTWVPGTDANNYVLQGSTTTSSYRKVLLSYQYGNAGDNVSSNINQVYAARYVEVQPSNGYIRANRHVTIGGTSAQFVKGDGTLDSTSYLTISSISASPGGIIEGALAGTITIGHDSIDFIVNPARPVISGSTSSGVDNYQGVVRPMLEFNTTSSGDNHEMLDGGISIQYNPTNNINVATTMEIVSNMVLVPIVTVYRHNYLTGKKESMPFIAVTRDMWEHVFSLYQNLCPLNA